MFMLNNIDDRWSEDDNMEKMFSNKKTRHIIRQKPDLEQLDQPKDVKSDNMTQTQNDDMIILNNKTPYPDNKGNLPVIETQDQVSKDEKSQYITKSDI